MFYKRRPTLKTYKQTITIPKDRAEKINRILTVEPTCEEECFTNTYSETATFPNGYQMDIKYCGVNYEDGNSNTSWTEAVLFNKHGGQEDYSEIKDEFLSKWELESNNIRYIVDVKTI